MKLNRNLPIFTKSISIRSNDKYNNIIFCMKFIIRNTTTPRTIVSAAETPAAAMISLYTPDPQVHTAPEVIQPGWRPSSES